MKILVTGTSSGLGRYLFEELGTVAFQRKNPLEIALHKNSFYDCIIHCATDARNNIASYELLAYYQSHIKLTEQLIQIPHHHFVFISSAAVYPDPFRENKETDIPNVPETSFTVHYTYYLYGLFKLLAEQIVSANSKKPLILRCVSIIGRTARINANMMKIIRNDPSPLTLSPKSSFNLVSMEQIKGFIELALDQNITGIFNAGSTQNATLEEIAKAVKSQPQFGTFVHNVHRMDTSKIRAFLPDFNKTSAEVAKEVNLEFQ